mgnify:FL=1
MDFFKTISSWIEPAIDFIAGKKAPESYESEVFGASRDRSGGFLGLVKAGASAYNAMQDSKEKEALEAVKYQRPEITRYTGRAASAQQSAGITPVGLRNPDMQAAMRKFMQRANTNPQLSRLHQQYAVNRTIQQGRRTSGLEPARLPSATKMAPATVRKEATET